MCKFNACGIWKYLDEYNYFMRIDEDVIIKKVDLKLLNNPTNLDNSFYTASLSGESHEPTNDTLPLFLKSLFKLVSCILNFETKYYLKLLNNNISTIE